MKRTLTIAVSGLNNHDNPGPGIPVVRALRESTQFDVRIIGLIYEHLEPGVYLPGMADRSYQIPYPAAGRDQLLDRLAFIHQREQIDIIIPNFDAELYSYIMMEPALAAMGVKMLLPTHEQFEARQKYHLNAYGEQYDIAVPKSITVASVAELYEAGTELGYPLMVKGKFYEAYSAYTPDAAVGHFHNLAAKWGLPVVVQQFVQGEEYNVVALGDGAGGTIGVVPMRKRYITNLGKAWAGITIADDDLVAMARNLIERTNWRGPFELEIMKAADGTLHLMEINPRFPAWVYLAVGAGQNLPEAAVLLALGEQPESYADFAVGKLFVRYSMDHICDISEFQEFAIAGEK